MIVFSILEVPLDLAQYEDLESLTSEWLLNQVFNKLKGISKINDEVVPVCLASLDSKAESVDYFLTKANEPISNFLSLNKSDLKLKLCYAP